MSLHDDIQKLIDGDFTRITDNDLIAKIRELAGTGDQRVPTLLDGKITPVILVNPDALSITASSDPVEVFNSTVVGNKALSTRPIPEGTITMKTAKTTLAVGDNTLYTVTALKTLYITSITVQMDTVGDYIIKDGGSTEIIYTQAPNVGNGPPLAMTFPTPLKFTDSFVVNVAGITGTRWSFSGWEELT